MKAAVEVKEKRDYRGLHKPILKIKSITGRKIERGEKKKVKFKKIETAADLYKRNHNKIFSFDFISLTNTNLLLLLAAALLLQPQSGSISGEHGFPLRARTHASDRVYIEEQQTDAATQARTIFGLKYPASVARLYARGYLGARDPLWL